MTRYPLIAAAALAVALGSAVPASANHEPFCIQSTDHVLWCSPDLDETAGDPICLQTTDHVLWCSPRPSELLHGEASASSDSDESEPICVYPYDGGWCAPTVRELREQVPAVPQYCMHPWDGSICTPTVRDVAEAVDYVVPDVRVTEFCVYPYDGGWCVPWVEVGS